MNIALDILVTTKERSPLHPNLSQSPIAYNSQQDSDGGNGKAVSLPQNNPSHFQDVTIARLTVGKRHCRVLISATLTNCNSYPQIID
jgi:hypothetical protein